MVQPAKAVALASVVAVSPAIAPALCGPLSATTELIRPPPVVAAVERTVRLAGGVQELTVEDFAAQYDSVTSPGAGTVEAGVVYDVAAVAEVLPATATTGLVGFVPE
jgi:hypothetical protein